MNVPVAWVISHDADMQRVIELNLCKRGLRCIASGPAELPAVKPRLVILDVDPSTELDWGTARNLRRDLPGVPMILIATQGPTASQLAALEPVFYVHKPMSIDELLDVIRASPCFQDLTIARKGEPE
jgi:DNA-binding response OmpR family regulator